MRHGEEEKQHGIDKDSGRERTFRPRIDRLQGEEIPDEADPYRNQARHRR